MQPQRAGAIDGEPAHQHHTRLRARAQDHGNARQSRLKSLAEKASRPSSRTERLERDRSYRSLAPPLAKALAPLAGTNPQVVKCILPTGILGKSRIRGIQAKGSDPGAMETRRPGT